MADRLQMIAELIDKNVGANAKKIEKAFADLGRAHARDLPAAFKKYQSAVIRQEKELEQFTKRSVVIRREIEAFKGIVARTTPMVFELTKSVGSFTLGSGAAVGAIAAVGAAIYEAAKVAAEFSESMRQIKFGSAETGLGQLQIKQLVQALAEFGLDAGEASQGFHGLKAAISEITARPGIFKQKLSHLGEEIFNYANPIIEEAKTEGTTTAKVYAEIRKQLDRISADHPDDPALAHDLRRRLVQGMGLSPKFALAGEAAMQEKLEVIKKLGTTSEEMAASVEASRRFNELMDDVGVGLDKWLRNLGTGITKVLLFVNETMDRIGLDKTRALGMLLAPFTGGISAGASSLFDAWVRSHPGLTPFAGGGLVTKPTLALVGEAGPEYITRPGRTGRLVTEPTVTTLGANGPEKIVPATSLLTDLGQSRESMSARASSAVGLEHTTPAAYERSKQAQWAEYKQFMGHMGGLMPHADWAKFERGARPSTNIEDFRRGHPATDEDTASGHRTFNAPQDRANIDGALRNQSAINSSGQLDVHVPGTPRHTCERGGRRYFRKNKREAQYSDGASR